MRDVQIYQRLLSNAELKPKADISKSELLAKWNHIDNEQLVDSSGNGRHATWTNESTTPDQTGLVAQVSIEPGTAVLDCEDGNVRLRIRASNQPRQFTVRMSNAADAQTATMLLEKMAQIDGLGDLRQFTRGGPPNYPEVLETESIIGSENGPFAVDVFVRPTDNPWNCQLRLTGLDFHPDGNTAVLSTWDGSVFKVSGLLDKTTKWKRIAAGLFQPLGIKWIDDKIYVTCRDQLWLLHDLNGDGEADFYECLNNDHQVTEHFHEFAMGLQTDADGNFYYAKSARHALPAVVPHHGTLLQSRRPTAQTTEILANGFRAANGVCLNPDGTLRGDRSGRPLESQRTASTGSSRAAFTETCLAITTSPMNRIPRWNQPLCWITNAFDRSPAELLWVDSPKWGPLNGSLLNFSYGYGKVYIVPHEKVDGQMQGGMCAFRSAAVSDRRDAGSLSIPSTVSSMLRHVRLGRQAASNRVVSTEFATPASRCICRSN